jgi:hypothetical protein
MGLGGWILQEGYMLKLGELGQQHVFHRKLAGLVGEKSVAEFQRASIGPGSNVLASSVMRRA